MLCFIKQLVTRSRPTHVRILSDHVKFEGGERLQSQDIGKVYFLKVNFSRHLATFRLNSLYDCEAELGSLSSAML